MYERATKTEGTLNRFIQRLLILYKLQHHLECQSHPQTEWYPWQKAITPTLKLSAVFDQNIQYTYVFIKLKHRNG